MKRSTLTNAEKNTILASLRLLQQQFPNVDSDIYDILTDGDVSVSATDIDSLCERINFAVVVLHD